MRSKLKINPRVSYFISVLILCFISSLILFCHPLEHPVDVPLDVYYRLHEHKKLLKEMKIGGDRVRIFVEKLNEEMVSLENGDCIESILEETYEYFEPFLLKDHLVVVDRKAGSKIDLIFLNEKTYRYIEHLYRQIKTVALYAEIENTAYFKSPDNVFDVDDLKDTLRHELFHHLCAKYDVDLEEIAARRF